MMKLMKPSTQPTSQHEVGATVRPSASRGKDTASSGWPGAASAAHTPAHVSAVGQNGRRLRMTASPSRRQPVAS